MLPGVLGEPAGDHRREAALPDAGHDQFELQFLCHAATVPVAGRAIQTELRLALAGPR
jgi:hypothetical protein